MSQRVYELLSYGVRELKSRDIEDALVSAGEILSHILRKSKTLLYAGLNEAVGEREKDSFLRLVRKRCDRYPLQYLTKSVSFRHTELSVTEGTFIPRPETECLVDVVLARLMRKGERELKVLDVGTGTGCLAISLALEISGVRVVATDRSRHSLELAQKNAFQNSVAEKITFVQTSYWNGLKGCFDLVVSNPPYLSEKDFLGLQREVQFEPKLALDGGIDGLRAYRRIARRVREVLRPGGMLAVEIGFGQADAVENLLKRNGFCGIERTRDLAGIERIISGVLENGDPPRETKTFFR